MPVFCVFQFAKKRYIRYNDKHMKFIQAVLAYKNLQATTTRCFKEVYRCQYLTSYKSVASLNKCPTKRKLKNY